MSWNSLQRNIVLVLKRHRDRHGVDLSPKEIWEKVHFHWRKPSRDNVRDALKALNAKGCVVCTGATWQRKCQATTVRPVSMRGKASGSAIGRAIGAEITRQDAYRYMGIVPTGSLLERAWPLFQPITHRVIDDHETDDESLERAMPAS